jgi:hypothetical protein
MINHRSYDAFRRCGNFPSLRTLFQCGSAISLKDSKGCFFGSGASAVQEGNSTTKRPGSPRPQLTFFVVALKKGGKGGAGRILGHRLCRLYHLYRPAVRKLSACVGGFTGQIWRRHDQGPGVGSRGQRELQWARN